MAVLIIDYEGGNLSSVCKIVADLGATPKLSQNPEDLSLAHSIILPGVGTFFDAAEKLRLAGWVEPIRDTVASGVPLIGICVGMQLLADVGEEGGISEGLGLVPGRVIPLVPDIIKGERVPHMGWNNLNILKDDHIFDGIISGADVYFAHSFYFSCADLDNCIATTEYCGETTAVIRKDNVIGAQFHPEISSSIGRKFLKNFLSRTETGSC